MKWFNSCLLSTKVVSVLICILKLLSSIVEPVSDYLTHTAYWGTTTVHHHTPLSSSYQKQDRKTDYTITQCLIPLPSVLLFFFGATSARILLPCLNIHCRFPPNCCGGLPANICCLASFVPASFSAFHHWSVSNFWFANVHCDLNGP